MEKLRWSEIIKIWRPNVADNTHPRFIGSAGMNTVPKQLAKEIPVLTNKKVVQIRERDSEWEVCTENGELFTGQHLIVTMPAPQALQLLENSNIHLSDNPLSEIRYHPCLVVLAKLDKASGIPAPGCLFVNGDIVSWLADNFQKGISNSPCLTIHASPAFSAEHLDSDLQAAGQQMLESAAVWIDPAKVLDWQVHRWRYSLCYQRHTAPFWMADTKVPLLFGGDGFGMGNVEGAFVSGVTMAGQILKRSAQL